MIVMIVRYLSSLSFFFGCYMVFSSSLNLRLKMRILIIMMGMKLINEGLIIMIKKVRVVSM